MAASLRFRAALLLSAMALLLTAVYAGEQVTTCDWYALNIHRLHCDHGVINVEQALYGRSSSLICHEGKSHQELANVRCAQQGTFDKIKTRCNGKTVCEVGINDLRNPDPCPGTFKYLQTNFTCLHAFTSVACEQSEAYLYCDPQTVIFVYGADYGRRDRVTCANKRQLKAIENTNCLHPTDIVASRCNGKHSCRIAATNYLFGDPCVGTYKYLEVSYTCHSPGSDLKNGYFYAGEQVTTCDWYALNIHRLHCDHGVINVEQALYGRSSSLICHEGKSHQELANVRCAQQGTFDKIKTRCNGKTVCEVGINELRNPDPCPGTFKYLQTNFTCVYAFTSVACEQSEAYLYCDPQTVIFVYGADYGRRDRVTCANKRQLKAIENTNCLHPTDIVASRCNGKHSCRIAATNYLFGDPCVGTYKYLEVSYTCHSPGSDLKNGY
ncbi:L-rhamnose-binding lectin CSL1-like [Syngnathus typhle]|uniref:L-rhamnose-binding lectin CSL1-like n=1 Tax=Syngnathus typhle TaxID=161592 RepID=UPI002A6B541E|nr:L-rhamnose-binding lectin CSL1-like [Syngnathus typhle]